MISGFNPMVIKESVDEIVDRKNKALSEGGEQADLFYTRLDDNGAEFKCSCIIPLYRSVYETELVKKIKSKK